MKFCARHWDALKAQIKAYGLDGLIAKSGEEVASKMMSELEAGSKKSNFDPLMAAHNMIVSRALDIIGLALLASNEDGSERCPLCFLQKGHDENCKELDCKHSFEPWVEYAAKDALEEAKRLGLVGGD